MDAHPDPASFAPLVYAIVRQIPERTVATYGQIASMIPAPEGMDTAAYARLAPRWVGDVLNGISAIDEPTIPWHRVINSRGGISLPNESRAAALQRARLRHEGVIFDEHEVIDLDVFGWDGPPEAFLAHWGLNRPKSIRRPPPQGPRQMSLF
jgi:methylated-DNA-protein-cysteine methyltransferase related protein